MDGRTTTITGGVRGSDLAVPMAAHALLLACFGAAYSFGALFGPLSAAFGVGSFPTATVFSLTAAIYYVVGAFSGQVADIAGAGRVTAAGVALVAAGFAVASGLTGSLPAFAAAFCPLVGCGVGLAYVPAIAAVQRRPSAGRSRASGIALAGTGVGTFAGPVLASALLSVASLQATMLAMAAAVLAVGIPASLALGRHGTVDAARHAAHPEREGMCLRDAARTARFWCLGGAILTGSVGQFTVLVHLAPYAASLGVKPMAAGTLVGLVGAGSVAGRLGLGWLADRVGHLGCLLALSAALAAMQAAPAARGRSRRPGPLRAAFRRGQRGLHRAVPHGRGGLVRHGAARDHPRRPLRLAGPLGPGRRQRRGPAQGRDGRLRRGHRLRGGLLRAVIRPFASCQRQDTAPPAPDAGHGVRRVRSNTSLRHALTDGPSTSDRHGEAGNGNPEPSRRDFPWGRPQ